MHLWLRVSSWQKGNQDPGPLPLSAAPAETNEITNKAKAVGKVPPSPFGPGIHLLRAQGSHVY